MTGDKIVDGCAWYPGTGADTSACEVGSVVSLGKTERKTWALFALHWDWGDCATWAAMLPASVPVSPPAYGWTGRWADWLLEEASRHGWNGPAADHLDNAQGLAPLAMIWELRAHANKKCRRAQSGGIRRCNSFDFGFSMGRYGASHAAQVDLSILQDMA